MAMLPGAHDLVVSNSQFHIHNIHNSANGPSGDCSSDLLESQVFTSHVGIDVLLGASLPGAAVDAEARQYAPSCFPGTREQYIDDITNWANASSDDQGPPIYWMRGPAGVGKSAIAQTCAEKVKAAGHLGAAFFFSVSGRSDHTRFFTTLAYQLSTVLPNYRQLLDRAIQNDKTLVTKALSSQFDSLIVEPLRELGEQGKEVRTRAIFIDGLDECSSTDAQSKIIEIVAASVRDGTTPFRWAIFSRAEAHIVSAFARNDISPHVLSVLLPISRDSDGEIEKYLHSGFENMLRRRNIPLSPSWPTNEAINRLVDASAGLFAYPAAVLRFIDNHSYSGFMKTLEAVLGAIVRPDVRQPYSPFADLDAFYILIMERIPEDILPSALLLLGSMIVDGYDGQSWHVAVLCNVLELSDTDFRGVFNALQAVIFHRPPGTPVLDQNVDFARSYYDQDLSSGTASLETWFDEVHGTVNFYHKSFYDFLLDPTRSSTFCTATSTIREKLFHQLVQRHLHYARGFVIHDAKLVSVPGILSSSVSLSWPQGSEFVDSYLNRRVFRRASWLLCHDFEVLSQFLKNLPQSVLQKLAELDYRKYLVSESPVDLEGLYSNAWVIGRRVGKLRIIPGTEYLCVTPENFSTLDLVAFLRMVKKFQDMEVIRPYHHLFPSTFTSAYHSLLRLKASGKCSGQYKLGRGEKSVVWYWEFDTVKQYFRDFRTVNFSEAKRIYDAEKFNMWESSWVMP